MTDTTFVTNADLAIFEAQFRAVTLAAMFAQATLIIAALQYLQ